MIELLLKLEMSLWINETRNNFEYMNNILHNDFKEFGKNGKVYSKKDILDDLNLDLEVDFPFENLNVKQVDKITFLITYTCKIKHGSEIIKSNRSSLWLGEDRFQLLFHQGTLTI